MKILRIRHLLAASAALAVLAGAAQAQDDDAQIEAEVATDAVPALPQGVVAVPVVQPIPGIDPLPEPEPLPDWELADAEALLGAIKAIGAEGLVPTDYGVDGLRMAIAMGAGAELNQAATTSFTWLVEDLRDGRTPMAARTQWFVVDPDADLMPTEGLLRQALESHDVAGVLASLEPEHHDYTVLKQALADTPESEAEKRKLIRANMDRWRWLARDLGSRFLITNVPEYQLRLTVRDKDTEAYRIISSYRTVVGKPGRTATPQLAEEVEGVVFNPTWTVPQSIVKGEGLGQKVLSNPSWARSKGYVATRGANGYISVVQQPGTGNSLGQMKLDMPNEHAIFLHDTPSKSLFNTDRRAYSHGCIRTERAQELAITMAILGRGASKDEAVQIASSGKYTKVALQRRLPVYITYFTMAQSVDGKLTTFEDIYDRDAPVLASFDAPRQMNRARVTTEEVIEIIDDLQD